MPYLYNSTNTWHSVDTFDYIYEGIIYTNFLGNYFDDHGASDSDNNGIGDSPYAIPIDGSSDEYPLVDTIENYTILLQDQILHERFVSFLLIFDFFLPTCLKN